MQVKKQQLELDMELQTGSKLGKEYIKAVYCYPSYVTYMQSTSCEMPGWMKQKLESRLPGEISITSDTQMTPPLGQKVKRTEEPLDDSEKGETRLEALVPSRDSRARTRSPSPRAWRPDFPGAAREAP